MDCNACLGCKVLKTIKVYSSHTDKDRYYFDNHKLLMPDNDQLYLECIDGYRYKRDIKINDNGYFFFNKI